MAGRHNARAGGLRRVGDVIVEHPFRTGAVATAALVAALVVTPLVTADLAPAPAHSGAQAPGVSPVVALSVPNVIGLSESRARDTLRERGFSVVFRTESGAPATGTDAVVVRQSPGAGAHAAKGTKIALTVAAAGSTVSTPPQNAAATTGPGTVSAPAGAGVTPATGGAGSTGGAGNSGAAGSGAGGAGAAGSGGAVPAPPAPVPAPVPAPSPPAAPVTPPPVVQVPVPPLPLPTLPVSPLGIVSGLLRGVV